VEKIFDIIIVGAGPAGAACAISLKDSGLNIAIIDKSVFPREKICGEGLTLDVIKQLPLLSEELSEAFHKLVDINPSYGLRVYSAENKEASIPILQHNGSRAMYTVKREVFDNLLIQFIKEKTNISVFENCLLQKIENYNNSIRIHTSQGILNCSMIVGADGAHSVVAKTLRSLKIEKKDKAIALRCYYENVDVVKEGQFLEFYFTKKILPGGLWIFPVGNNIYNVGLGMPIDTLVKKKINLQKVLDEEIESGALKDKFKNARPISRLKGDIIPLGKPNRPISGERFLRTGDAAGLANALSGEGIGNALRSGRVAAMHIKSSFEHKNFSATYNKKYDKEIYRRMGREFYNYRVLQYLCSFPSVINYLIGKVAPHFINVFGNPEFVTKIQAKRFFLLRVLKYVVLKKS